MKPWHCWWTENRKAYLAVGTCAFSLLLFLVVALCGVPITVCAATPFAPMIAAYLLLTHIDRAQDRAAPPTPSVHHHVHRRRA